MWYMALATDYDGTLAPHGVVSEKTIAALERVRESGRRLIMVTGRQVGDLEDVFPRLDLFDRVVGENGAVLYRPQSRETLMLTRPAEGRLVDALRERGVPDVSVGACVVALSQPHETAALEAIRDLGLELSVIFNKGSVMILPAGVTKATGLAAAVAELGLSVHNVVGIGDGENDHDFLEVCEAGVAVANALPALKERADLVVDGAAGDGVRQLVERLLADDLASVELPAPRCCLHLGEADGEAVGAPLHGGNLLLAGRSGSGKSNLTTALLEQLADRGYQFMIIDPEGDYDELPNAVTLGTPDREPVESEIVELLEGPQVNVVVNLLGLPVADRPGYFRHLFPLVQRVRSERARPHRLIIDEAHHMLPSTWQPAELTLPSDLKDLILVTVHPGSISPALLASVEYAVAVGEARMETLTELAEAMGELGTEGPGRDAGSAVLWQRGRPARAFTPVRPRSELKRHQRKYAEGNLGEDKSFYFRGPDGRLNLRAQNLTLFLQMAEGVDDETWLYHLRAGDYSAWIREAVKDDALADEVAAVEGDELSPADSRARVREAVEARYTGPE